MTPDPASPEESTVINAAIRHALQAIGQARNAVLSVPMNTRQHWMPLARRREVYRRSLNAKASLLDHLARLPADAQAAR